MKINGCYYNDEIIGPTNMRFQTLLGGTLWLDFGIVAHEFTNHKFPVRFSADVKSMIFRQV